MPRFRAAIAVASVILTVGLGASPAQAATTVGQTLDPTGSGCTNGLLAFETTAPNNQYIVPTAGILTSWSFFGSGGPTNTNSTLKFKVARPTGNQNEFLIIGESDVKAPVAGMNTYTDISIPVEAGDVIGFYTLSGGDCSAKDPSNDYLARVMFEGSDQSSPGSTKTLSNVSAYQLNVSATLESDDDGDGRGDETEDNCVGVSNAGQEDTDGDGRGNLCDNCPSAANATQLDTDQDLMGDACDPDDDNDNVTDAADNCQLLANDQANSDGDGQGDACDPDDDNDGTADASDSCRTVAGPASNSGCPVLVPDLSPPDTTINSGPPVKTDAREVKFGFVSSEPGSTFQCKLTGKKLKRDALKQYAPCTSMKKYKRLKPGKYKFFVVATDDAGNTDPTPAKQKFKIVEEL